MLTACREPGAGGAERTEPPGACAEQPGLRAVWGPSEGHGMRSSQGPPSSRSPPREVAAGQGCITPARPQVAPGHSSVDPDAILCLDSCGLAGLPAWTLPFRGPQPPAQSPAAPSSQAPSRSTWGYCLAVPSKSLAASRLPFPPAKRPGGWGARCVPVGSVGPPARPPLMPALLLLDAVTLTSYSAASSVNWG